jgi:WD40 repeat protein
VHTDTVWSLAWAGTDHTLSASADGICATSSAATGERVYATSPHAVGLTTVSASQDGARAVFCALGGHTALLDVGSGEILAAYESGSAVVPSVGGLAPAWAVSLAPDGGTYAAAGASGSALLHSASPDTFGALRASLAPPGNPQWAAAVAHVRSRSPSATHDVVIDSELSRARMANELRSGRVRVSYMCSRPEQALSPRHSRRTRWLSVRLHGRPTRTCVISYPSRTCSFC